MKEITSMEKKSIVSNQEKNLFRMVGRALAIGDNDDIVDARRTIEEVIDTVPNNSLLWSAYSRFMADYHFSEAQQTTSQAIRQCPSSKRELLDLAYTFDRISESSADNIDEFITFLENAIKKDNSPDLLASLSNLLRCSGKIERAYEISEEALALDSFSLSANLAAAKTAYSMGQFLKSYQHMRAALQINTPFAWWNLIHTYSGFLDAVLYHTDKADELADWLDQQLQYYPGLNYLPLRPTAWHLQSLRDQRKISIEKELPSCLLIPQGKSGSTSVASIFNRGFGLISTAYSLVTHRVIESWARDYNRGGVCWATHLKPTPLNISLLKKAGIQKAIVHIRDPRQSILSLTHYLMKFEKEDYGLRDTEYKRMDISKKIDFILDTNWMPTLQWIEGWFKASNEMEISFTAYEEFVQDKEKFLRKILAAYGGNVSHFNRDVVIQEQSDIDYHFRKGEVDEWREVFSPSQIDRVNDSIPTEMAKYFNWKK